MAALTLPPFFALRLLLLCTGAWGSRSPSTIMFPPWPLALAVLQTDTLVSAAAPIGTRMIAAAMANASIVLDRVLRRFIPIVTIDLLEALVATAAELSRYCETSGFASPPRD